MPRRTRVAWRRGAFRELRTLPAVMEKLTAEADDMARRAGPGYEAREARVTGGRGRGRASVGTGDIRSMADNAKNHTLLRVLAGKSGLVKYTSKAGRESYITQAQYDNYTRGARG